MQHEYYCFLVKIRSTADNYVVKATENYRNSAILIKHQSEFLLS